MHFPIIEIVSDKRDIGYYSLDGDVTIEYFSDYYGNEYSKDERKNIIKDLSKFFEGLAIVHVEKETITVNPEDEIRSCLIEYHKNLIEKLKKDINSYNDSVWKRFSHLRQAGYHYKHSDWMFFVDGGGYTSQQFVEDLVFFAGKTLYIGKIYNAHY